MNEEKPDSSASAHRLGKYQAATALGGASREENVLLLVIKGKQGRGLMCCLPFQAGGLFPPSFWENALGTKQQMKKGCHKGDHSPSRAKSSPVSSLVHSFTKCALSIYQVPATGT